MYNVEVTCLASQVRLIHCFPRRRWRWAEQEGDHYDDDDNNDDDDDDDYEDT